MRVLIRNEIEQITPYDSLEAAHRADALAWIDSGVEIFRLVKPNTPPKHLCAYFAPVDHMKILLGLHRTSGLWMPAGGHIESGENPRDTVRREALEELSLVAKFVIERPLFITMVETVGFMEAHTDVDLWYVIEGVYSELPKFDEREFIDMRWYDFDQLPVRNVEPHLSRFVAKLRSCLCG